MGSVYKRGDVFWLKYRQGARLVRESAGTADLDEARRLLSLREGKIARFRGAVTFDDLAALVVSDYRTNGKRSLDDVEGHLRRHLFPFLSRLPAKRVTTGLLRHYVRLRQEEGASAATINRELAVVKRGFSLARRDELLDYAPFIPRLREDNTREGYFERPQFEAMRAALPAYLRPVVTFAYITGWRVPSEVLTRQWAHVDFEARVVRLEPGETKNREGRIFPFTVDLSACLSAQREVADGPWVFHRAGRRIQSFRKAWAKACADAGLGTMVRHDLRRTAARNLLDAGVAERDVMLMLGWRTRTMIDRYARMRLASLREGAAKLDARTA